MFRQILMDFFIVEMVVLIYVLVGLLVRLFPKMAYS